MILLSLIACRAPAVVGVGSPSSPVDHPGVLFQGGPGFLGTDVRYGAVGPSGEPVFTALSRGESDTSVWTVGAEAEEWVSGLGFVEALQVVTVEGQALALALGDDAIRLDPGQHTPTWRVPRAGGRAVLEPWSDQEALRFIPWATDPTPPGLRQIDTTTGAALAALPWSEEGARWLGVVPLRRATPGAVVRFARATDGERTLAWMEVPQSDLAGVTTHVLPYQPVLGADLDGDGWDDLVSRESTPEGSLPVVVSFTPDGPDGPLADVRIESSAQVFATSLAVGDLDGDGAADLVVSTGPMAEPGRVSIFRGPLEPGTYAESDADLVFTMVGMNGFGTSVAAGDLNGDGVDELAVGSPGLRGGLIGYEDVLAPWREANGLD
ncbi:MAG: VCBS repeat-containing protein [Myxococcales bacterium]|nr:VCBS repeat-containing protein [Myxococcales bacterium]